MTPKIGTISIERFRAFRELKIEGLGRVNLITGRNNTGKSTVLEALRILASNASPPVIGSILHYREEDIGEPEEQDQPTGMEGLLQISSLFNGFPSLSESIEPIAIYTDGSQWRRALRLAVDWLLEKRDSNGTMRLVPQETNHLGK